LFPLIAEEFSTLVLVSEPASWNTGQPAGGFELSPIKSIKNKVKAG
jgi:hypothetical protein